MSHAPKRILGGARAKHQSCRLSCNDGSRRVEVISHLQTKSFPAHRHRSSLSLPIINAGVQVLLSLGVDQEQLQKDWGVRLSSLRDPYRRLPSFLARRFWEVAKALSGDPAIGLHAAQQADPSLMLGVAYLMELMPDRLSALRVMARYWPLIAGHLDLDWKQEGRKLRLTLIPNQPLSAAHEEVDYWCMRQALHLKARPGTPVALLEVHMRRSPPFDASPWREKIGCDVHFGAARDELVLDIDALLVSRPAGSAAVCASLEKALEGYALKTEKPSTLESVAAAVLLGIRDERSFDMIAAQHHATTRTLRRELTREGWGYGDIADVQRRLLSSDLLLLSKLSISEVADSVGYFEVSNFLRAFRRWYDVTPSEFRKHNVSVLNSIGR